MYNTFSRLVMPKKRHQLSRRVYALQARKLTGAEYLKWLGIYGEFFWSLKRFFNQRLPFSLLVIMGDEDYIFLKAARKFVRHHPQSALQLIPRAGHICNIDQPDQFNRMALRFLS